MVIAVFVILIAVYLNRCRRKENEIQVENPRMNNEIEICHVINNNYLIAEERDNADAEGKDRIKGLETRL